MIKPKQPNLGHDHDFTLHSQLDVAKSICTFQIIKDICHRLAHRPLWLSVIRLKRLMLLLHSLSGQIKELRWTFQLKMTKSENHMFAYKLLISKHRAIVDYDLIKWHTLISFVASKLYWPNSIKLNCVGYLHLTRM